MSDFGSLFSDLSGVLDALKPETLEKLGPFGDHVKLVGQALTAAAAVLALVFGYSSWAPPTPAMPKLPVIGTAVIVAAGLFVLTSQGGKATGDVDLWRWCFGLLAVGLASLLAYYLLKSWLCFSCDYDPDIVHVAGLRLKRQARFVLRGEENRLTGQYVLHRRADGTLDIPAGAKDYFCRTDRAGNFVWQGWSELASSFILILAFWLALPLLPLGLYAGAEALTQPDLKVDNRTITLRSDVLFAFDSDAIRTTAAPSLASAADIVRTKKVLHARIAGYTDGIGPAAYNRDLSLRRANVVKAWLVDKEGLGKVTFDTVGYGADPEHQVAKETRDGKDDPQARQANRRVEIEMLP
jgi:hypothetical protein